MMTPYLRATDVTKMYLVDLQETDLLQGSFELVDQDILYLIRSNIKLFDSLAGQSPLTDAMSWDCTMI